MEVIMMEYSLVSFAPVILAAVTATTLSQSVYGPMPAFSIPNLHIGSLLELPYVILMGGILGTLAALFIYLLQRFTGLLGAWPVWLRCTLAGLLVGGIAIAVPQVMGIGYDTVNQALLGQLGVPLLISIVLGKLVATAAGLGLGLPGGLIGPTFVIGATAGGAMGIIADNWLPGDIASPAFYAMIGMGTMMGATLQAPLAALTAMLELTANPNIILPGMLALITGCLVSRELFGRESVYVELLRTRGLDYRDNPLTQTLRRIGVASIMDRKFATLPAKTVRRTAKAGLAGEPRWILVTVENRPATLLPAADLARYLLEHQDVESINLDEIPAQRREIAAIDFQATLQEALALLDSARTEALYVTRRTIPGIDRVYGIVTRHDIERSYRLE
jgi:hypothetical protein